jgi:hypothetical protein
MVKPERMRTVKAMVMSATALRLSAIPALERAGADAGGLCGGQEGLELLALAGDPVRRLVRLHE